MADVNSLGDPFFGPDLLLVIDAGTDEKLELVEREEVRLLDGVIVEAIELLLKPGLLDADAGAEARDVAVDAEMLEENVGKIAAKEVVVKVISRIKSRGLSILLMKVTPEMMPVKRDF